jgi:Biotin carboxylase
MRCASLFLTSLLYAGQVNGLQYKVSYAEDPKEVSLLDTEVFSDIKSFFRHNNKKVLLLIEPCLSSHLLIIEAEKNGYIPIVITAKSDYRKIPEEALLKSPFVFVIDTNKDEEVLSFVKRLAQHANIDAVIPGAEYYVPLTAKVATLLGKKGLNSATGLKVRRKDLMRDALKNAGVLIPQYIKVSNVKELENAVHHIGFPCVIKPVDFAGSVGVKKVLDVIQARDAFNQIISQGPYDTAWGNRKIEQIVLVEEYIKGKEYSIEGYIRDGKVLIVSITEKFLSPEPDFVEVGHIIKSDTEKSLLKGINIYLDKVSKGLAIDTGPFHAELRISDKGPVLMEIAMRLAGDYIPKLIGYAYGINYYDNTFKLLTGEDLDLKKKNHMNVGITFFYRPEIKKITTNKFFEKIKSDQDVIDTKPYYQEGQIIPDMPMEKHKLGYAIIGMKNYSKLLDKMQKIEEMAHF